MTFFADARNGNTPALNVTLGNNKLFTQSFVGSNSNGLYTFETVPFTYDGTFNGGSTSALLSFAQTAGGDTTALLDDVQITAQPPAAAPEPSEWALLGFAGIGIPALLLRARKRMTA